MKNNKRVKKLQRQVKRLKKELHQSQKMKTLYLRKWEKWEERARELLCKNLP
jgi:hypothetical protein